MTAIRTRDRNERTISHGDALGRGCICNFRVAGSRYAETRSFLKQVCFGMFAPCRTGRARDRRANLSRNSASSTRTMPGDRQHFLLRNRRLRNWAAVFAVVALVAWVIEFATHLHVHHEAQVSAQGLHFCEMCAAFQAGASAPTASPIIPKLPQPLFRATASARSPQLQLTYSYRSRAPPYA